MPETQSVVVSQAESGQKLLQFLERRLSGEVPRSAIQKWIRTGQVRVDKGRKKPFDRLEAGQTVRIPPYAPGQDKQVSEAGGLAVAYEDAELLAVAKPAGLAAHGGDGVDDSVVARLRAMYRNADFMPTLAHRLDRDTSGLLLAAKSYAVLRELNDLFASNGVAKVYLAWVDGRWDEPDGTLLEDVMEKRGAPGAERVRTGSGKTALARVTGLVSSRDRSLVAVRLLTGRTHQIRVQLASRGHAVIGDRKYGAPSARGKGSSRGPMRLHCFALRAGERTISLPPAWSGGWAVDRDALQKALGLLFD
ncbi:pseudouridine synthase, RluA family [Pseudodesulfovibrio mercurii]|uniref:Pseudouridine synthase, RluA family n=1 Tax=Pseudodesulfovibrio mercurii TaxID=641491 RepID=F0JJE4_9BACT|nr:RluA family pseudouridine synthase [Pseudodesulfovibrio mercurii]EGB16043.1 pseudouridine synthase, RluA family [Pseudodesulfovibrio mercurii]